MDESFQNLLLKTITSPAFDWFETRYLKLRNSWERFAIHTKQTFSEHSLVTTMFLRTEAERAGLADPANDEVIKKGLDALAANGEKKFMPVARITVRHNGYVIRVQSMIEWPGGVFCSARVNLIGKEVWGFRCTKKPGFVDKAATGALSAIAAVVPKTKTPDTVAYQNTMKAAEKAQAAVLESVIPCHSQVDNRFAVSASKNVADLAQSPKFCTALSSLKHVGSLTAWGNPNSKESDAGNKISFDFISGIDSTELGHAIELAKIIVDELDARNLIQPPVVDEVLD